jgi:hypothetical protein
MEHQFKRMIDRLIKQYGEGVILECEKCSGKSFDVEGDISFKLSYTKPLFPEIFITDFITKTLNCTSCNESAESTNMVRDDLLFINLYRIFGHLNLEQIRRKLNNL